MTDRAFTDETLSYDLCFLERAMEKLKMYVPDLEAMTNGEHQKLYDIKYCLVLAVDILSELIEYFEEKETK